MERLTNSIDRRTMLTVILLTIPFYCLGAFAWSISPTIPAGDPTSTEFVVSTETPEFTLTPDAAQTSSGQTSTPKPTKTATATITKTITPTVTTTRTPTLTVPPSATATQPPTATASTVPTATIQPTATEQIFEFFTPTNLPSDILTLVP